MVERDDAASDEAAGTPSPSAPLPKEPPLAHRDREPRSRWALGLALLVTASCIGFAGYRFFDWRRSESDLLAHALELSGGRQSLPIFNLDRLAVARDSIVPGGPLKDGIPALTTLDALKGDQREPRLHGSQPPAFTAAAEAASLEPDARVIGVAIGDAARAYPVQVLDWHECINDVVGGVPIAVVYCPLCDSVTIVDRRLDGQVYEFGISGLLHNSNVILYDRTDQALWSQIGMRAISGPNVNKSLTHLDGWEVTTLSAWIDSHPGTEVLSLSTGHDRDYQMRAYDFYFEHDELAFPVEHEDPRLTPKTRVIGVRLGDQTRAYPLAALAQAPGGVLRDAIATDQEVVLSIDDEGGVRIDDIPEGGSAVHTFWYAWAAMHPGTELYTAPEP